jgi:peptide/nickel transport system substrate-binding protein
MKSRLFIGLAVAAGLAGLLPAPSRAEVVFKWANDGDVRSMDPYTLDETVQNSFLGNMYEPLIRRNKELGLDPALAVSWENTGPNVWRFHLRPGVKWQDGTAFSADDVLFSYKRITAKTSATSGNVGSVKDVKKIDALTVDFETKEPDPILPQEFTNWPIMPMQWLIANHSEEPLVVGNGDSFAHRNTMGTGPFRLFSREADRKNVLVRNPDWWDKPEHNLDRVEFNVITAASTRVAALLSGEMDMVYAVPPQDIDRLKSSPGIKIIQGPELRTIYLGMDQARDELLFSDVKGKNPFKDKRVRQAFALAIDVDAITSRVMRGQGVPLWEMWAPGVNGFNPALNNRPKVDLVKAKALLAEAGYPNGFTVTLDCPNDRYIADEATCTAIAAMMARVGVKVEVFARTKVKYFADIANSAGFKTSFYLLGWTPSTYDADNVIRDHLASREMKLGLGNAGGYSNKRVDQLEPMISQELDPKKRQAMIDEVIKIVQDDVGYIPLHQQRITWAARDNINLTQPADNSFPMRWVVKK